MFASRTFVIILAAVSPSCAMRTDLSISTSANPIRKVVSMLQNMQKKVEAEGKKEEELYEKFMCYCKTAAADLQASIDAAENKGPQVESAVKESGELLQQTKDDLAKAQTDREAAKSAVKAATAIREKEAAAFASLKAESEANIKAVTKAVAAIEAGAGSSFLQTPLASTLKNLVIDNKQNKIESADQEELLSFLSNTQSSAGSGEILGILKQLGDEMTKDLADATATEEGAIKDYGSLMAAKKKEVAALQKSIEAKMKKVGDLGVSLVEMKNDAGDTGAGLEQDKQFLADVEKNCATATASFEANQKARGEEVLALADTIKVLNDDDALELFKKTLPGSAASFMQVQVSSAELRARALEMIQSTKVDRARFDFIALALRGKKVGFDKVITMIDNMIATLKKEQVDDDSKKEYCEEQFDIADDKKKSVERDIKDEKAAIAQTQEAIETAASDMVALTKGIKDLDKAVADATEQRQEENAEYKALMASNTAAKEILAFAKNRLNKFYNPKLYKPPAKKELSREDRIVENMSFLQVRSAEDDSAAPPPPPAAIEPYKKSSGESGGVIAMLDLCVKDLDKEMTVAETEEKDAQADYEQMLKDSADKRAKDTKALTDKEAAKADMEGDLEASQASFASATKDLAATMQFIAGLHAECDWLLQYFDVRKQARVDETDAMTKAKAVLSGADFSLAQTASSRHLRRAA